MCGLTLCITPVTQASLPPSLALEHSLHAVNAARGPDADGTYATRVALPGRPELLVTLGASVLGLRGDGVTAQPLIGKRGVLAWNGQVFDGLNVGVDENDTQKIFDLLESGQDPDSVLDKLEGPWACVYLSGTTIHFGVDSLSRRSLLLHVPEPGSQCPSFILTSARSGEARQEGIPFQALNGGQRGRLDLDKLQLTTQGIDFSSALQLRPAEHSVSRILRDLPSSDTDLTPSVAETEALRFLEHLTTAVRKRVDNIPARSTTSSARLAILFSGGIDCTVLAYVVHCVLPPDEPIELINIAFEQPKTKGKETAYDVPDRLSGRAAVAELRAACPGRDFRFVTIDIELDDSKAHRQSIVDLMYPNNSEMDLSLAYPLYFASRGVGTVDGSPYTVTAKVYLSGLGVDEQLGGYSRHRKAFDVSWAALIDELQLDIDRLPERNLSRDDRILSSHARDARYPFLDAAFIEYLSSLPVWTKCNHSLGPGYGDKLLIRAAANRCGLPETAKRVKRAMQFGSRSAKLNEGPTGRGFQADRATVE